jgi:hypothetical protein
METQENNTRPTEGGKDLLTPKEKAQQFLDGNSIRFAKEASTSLRQLVLSLRRRCVDGRHTKAQAEKSFAFAGADIGIVMALERASKGKITAVESYKMVSKALSDLGTKFFYHTDTHAQHDEAHNHEPGKVCFGCGHAAKPTSSDLAQMYGVDAEQQKQLIDAIKSGTTEQDMAPLDETVLSGDHNENGVFVIDSDEMTVFPMNEETGEQYFVYDARLIKEFMEIVWKKLVSNESIDPKIVSHDEYLQSEAIQRDATVDLLATQKGKPTYVATVQNGKLVI